MGEIVNVNLIRVFEGPRHERLRFIWDCIAEHSVAKARIHWFANPHVAKHSSCLESMWKAELNRPERYALITEHDFLPDLRAWLPVNFLTKERPILAARYVTRNPNTRRLQGHSYVGPWYVLIDKKYIQQLHWEEWGEFHDPAHGMEHFLAKEHPDHGVRFLDWQDALPDHYGVHMSTGDHLFWARHLHDHENRRISGVCMGDMQRKHDQFVGTWARLAPEKFRAILRRRLLAKEPIVSSDDDPAPAGVRDTGNSQTA